MGSVKFPVVGTTANREWFNAEQAVDLIPILKADDPEADKFVKFCGKFMLTQGVTGTPRLEELMLPWQERLFRSAFQAQTTMVLQGKGSGKSVSISAMALGYLMYCAANGLHQRGLIAVVAPSIPSAKIVFDHIMTAILADPALRGKFKSNVQNRSVEHKDTGIVIQILAAELKAVAGRRPIMAIYDELWNLGTMREGASVVDQLNRGGRNWGEAFKTIYITTMSVEAPAGVFRKTLDYARKVRSGEIEDDTFIPALFTFPIKEREDLSIDDPEQWWRGMPSLTTDKQRGTMDATMLAKEITDAAASGDRGEFDLLLSQRLGVERTDLGSTDQAPLHQFWPEIARTETAPAKPIDAVSVGVDIGGLDDPAAVVALTRFNDKTLHAEPMQFLTLSGYDRAGPDLKETYDLAMDRGTLKVLGSAGDIDSEIAKIIMDKSAAAPFAYMAGGDEHGRAGSKQVLESLSGCVFTSVPQTYVLMGSALAALEANLMDHKITVAPCELLDANIGNALVTDLPSGGRKITKRDAGLSGIGQAKFDGLAALLNAVHLMNQSPDGSTADVSWMIG